MSRISELFQQGAKVLSIYCTAGFPKLKSTMEVLQALQADPAMAKVPRVLMSGHGCPDLRVIPTDAFIAKPAPLPEIAETVSRIIGRKL